MRLLPIGFPGKNRGMHPHRVQLLHAEVSVHPHRVQMHPVLVHFGNYDGASYIGNSTIKNLIQNTVHTEPAHPCSDYITVVLLSHYVFYSKAHFPATTPSRIRKFYG